jgi:hypothetical protein
VIFCPAGTACYYFARMSLRCSPQAASRKPQATHPTPQYKSNILITDCGFVNLDLLFLDLVLYL